MIAPVYWLLYEGCREFVGDVIIWAANSRVRAVGVELYRRSASTLDSSGVVGSSTSFSTSGKDLVGETMVKLESSKRAARRALDGVPALFDMAEILRIEPVGDGRRGEFNG